MAYDDENIIGEGAEYTSKGDFSKAGLCQTAIAKCFEVRGKEMKKGYFNYSLSADGASNKTWIPDNRKIFVSCVKALMGLLNPEISRNPNIQKRIKTQTEKEETIFKNYCYEEYGLEKDKDGRTMWKQKGIKFIPENDSSVIIKNLRGAGEIVPGGWNPKTDMYWSEMVDLYDGVFQILNDLIDSLNYFQNELGV